MTKAEVNEAIQKVVTVLREAGADRWTVQDKGALVAAVKLVLQGKAGK